jgi:hypothetical protein
MQRLVTISRPLICSPNGRLRVQDHVAGALGDGVGHAVAGATAGGQFFLDDVLAHQPTHNRPGPGLVYRQGGDFRDDDALGIHGYRPGALMNDL